MCVAKKPKVQNPAGEDEKDPAILRNPFLDGLLGNIAALRGGRNSLRIPLIDPLKIPVGGSGASGAARGYGSSGSSASSGGSSGGSASSGSDIAYPGGVPSTSTRQ